jgi:hypothetical protein
MEILKDMGEATDNFEFEPGAVGSRGYMKSGSVDGKTVSITNEYYGDTADVDNRTHFLKFVVDNGVARRIAHVEMTMADMHDVLNDEHALASVVRQADYNELTPTIPAQAA